MAGSLSTFFPLRPGTEQGRIVPQNAEAVEGSNVLCLGSDVPGRRVLAEVGDYLEYRQVMARGAGVLMRAAATLRAPATMPVVTAPGPFTLTDGDDLVLETRRGQVAVVFETDDFADIANATALEVAVAINARATGIAARVGAGQSVAMRPDIGGRIRASGTAVAKLGAVELGWRCEVVVDGARLASVHLKPGAERVLEDLAANLSVFPTDVEVRLVLRLDVIDGEEPIMDIYDATAITGGGTTTFTADGYRKVLVTFPSGTTALTWQNTLLTTGTSFTAAVDGAVVPSFFFGYDRSSGQVVIRRNSSSGTPTVLITALL